MNTGKRITIMLAAGIVAIAGLVGIGGSAQAAAIGACNSYAAVLAGQGMECTVTINNYDNGVAEYSTVTVKECHGAAYTVLLAPACTTTVIVDDELVDTFTQCNGTLNGGGSNVTCSVQVNNYFAGPATPAIATVNQCDGSGAGGTSPSGPPLNCAPVSLAIGATVIQCNGSVNGGGSPLRVNCDVPLGSETAQPITIGQCNGTVNGGGSVLFCHAEFTNSFNVDFALAGLPSAPAAGPATTTIDPDHDRRHLRDAGRADIPASDRRRGDGDPCRRRRGRTRAERKRRRELDDSSHRIAADRPRRRGRRGRRPPHPSPGPQIGVDRSYPPYGGAGPERRVGFESHGDVIAMQLGGSAMGNGRPGSRPVAEPILISLLGGFSLVFHANWSRDCRPALRGSLRSSPCAIAGYRAPRSRARCGRR